MNKLGRAWAGLGRSMGFNMLHRECGMFDYMVVVCMVYWLQHKSSCFLAMYLIPRCVGRVVM